MISDEAVRPTVDATFAALPQVWVALAAAEAALARIDEALRIPLGRGVTARFDFQEVCAWSWNSGAAVHVEDLVLHDEGLDLRMPDAELTRAHGVLRFWREASRLKPETLLDAHSLLRALGDRRVASSASAHLFPPRRRERRADDVHDDPLAAAIKLAQDVTTEDDREALHAWFDIGRRLPASWPAILRAAVMREAWAVIEPLPRRSFVGNTVLDALVRRESGLSHYRLAFELGARTLNYSGRRRLQALTAQARVAWWLEALKLGAASAYAERQRLDLALQVAERQAKGRRGDSRLPDLLQLLSERPVVTAPMAAARLGISQQAVRELIKQLGSAVTEVTGRQRYKGWRL